MTARTLAVLRKETIDALRDRRSLAAALVYSLFGPLVLGLALASLAADAGAGGPRLVVAGGERAPNLVAWLEDGRATVTRLPVGADEAAAADAMDTGAAASTIDAAAAAEVRSRRADVVLVIPAEFAERFETLRPAPARLVYDASRAISRAEARRARALLGTYGEQVAGLRLVGRGVSPSVARPIAVHEIDLSTPASRAGTVLAMLPIFLLMAAFISSMNTAIDTTAGERERGSLEALLVHPVRPAAFAVGKWIPGVLLSLAGTLLTLGVTRLVLGSRPLQDLEVPVGLALGDAATIVALLLPLALLAPALQMLAALFARSYKEAQTYLSLLLFLPTLPGFFLSLGRIEPPSWVASVPLVGHHILVSRVLGGREVGAEAAFLAIATVVLAIAAVALSARYLRDERIVFGRS